jgi:LytS/YehU family sensor histidine kinase
VAKEIEIIKLYLNIHLIRFEDRLSISYTIDPETENLSIPSFLLQPLVENAITHGISPYKQKGLIEINIHTDNQTITVEIRDNGENTVGYGNEGIGLSNTRRRLRALFGENNFLLELRKHPKKGSVALVQFPAIPF